MQIIENHYFNVATRFMERWYLMKQDQHKQFIGTWPRRLSFITLRVLFQNLVKIVASYKDVSSIPQNGDLKH